MKQSKTKGESFSRASLASAQDVMASNRIGNCCCLNRKGVGYALRIKGFNKGRI
jgi:hypothetical protein